MSPPVGPRAAQPRAAALDVGRSRAVRVAPRAALGPRG